MHATRLFTWGHSMYWHLMRIRAWLLLLGLAVIGAALGAVAAID